MGLLSSIAPFAPVIGGLLDNYFADERQEDSFAHAERQQARSDALQREFAQHGIRWRVEDARAAGVHPVFAMSGGGAAYAPSTFTVGSESRSTFRDMGQDLSRAVAAQETADQRALRLAVLEGHRAASERDFAHASYYRALERNLPRTPAAPSFGSDVVTGAYGGAQSFPVKGVGAIESHPLYADAVKLEPDVMASRSVMHGGETAGQDHPSMRQFVFPGGFKALLPATQGGGVPEEIDFTMIPLVIGANLERYGSRWIIDLVSYMTGRSPDKRDARARELGLTPPRR